jgi:hypothetical protein
MNLSVAQLCLLRSFLRGRAARPLEVGLRPIFLERCGAAAEEWEALEQAGYLARAGAYWELTDLGLRAFRRGKIGRYF